MTFIHQAVAGAITVPLLLAPWARDTFADSSGPPKTPAQSIAASSSATSQSHGAATYLGDVTIQSNQPPRSSPTPTGQGRSMPGAGRSPTAVTGIRWTWPLHPRPTVVRGFSVGPFPWDPGHRGVDLAAPPGTPVFAPAAGVVHFAGELAGRQVLSLDHGRGVLSSFEPVISSVRVGEPVSQGEVIGRVEAGHSHCVPGSCLHWGVRMNGQYVDPLTLPGIWRGEAILLPLGDAG